MELEAKILDISAGGRRIVILSDETAGVLGVHSSDRVQITYGDKRIIAIVNIAGSFPSDQIGLYKEPAQEIGLRSGDKVEVQYISFPESLKFIRKKVMGERLEEEEIKAIVRDVVEHHLSDAEIAAFLTAIHIRGASMEEIVALSRAMVETGKKIDFGKKPILDKHSIGGIPGDKTTILVTPIVAAAGYVIPKTSSRAVTSPAGTADRVECLCPVDLSVEEIIEVVKKTNGCMVWGGALELSPADDIFIQVEYSLGIDPMLLPSIMSKKKAIGSTHLVVDIPTGRGAKVKTIGEAHLLARDFIELGEALGINVHCGITFGEQPLGYAVGPALEAKEALEAIMGNGAKDLIDKATELAGILFKMAGIGDGKRYAKAILKSGKAEKKLREIIEAQGGNPQVKPEDIAIGDKIAGVISNRDGRVLWINNQHIAQIAREAGAPKDKGAGIRLRVKLGDRVKMGDILFEIYAERSTKLEAALKLAEALKPIGVGRRWDEKMLMDTVPTEIKHTKAFVIER